MEGIFDKQKTKGQDLGGPNLKESTMKNMINRIFIFGIIFGFAATSLYAENSSNLEHLKEIQVMCQQALEKIKVNLQQSKNELQTINTHQWRGQIQEIRATMTDLQTELDEKFGVLDELAPALSKALRNLFAEVMAEINREFKGELDTAIVEVIEQLKGQLLADQKEALEKFTSGLQELKEKAEEKKAERQQKREERQEKFKEFFGQE